MTHDWNGWRPLRKTRGSEQIRQCTHTFPLTCFRMENAVLATHRGPDVNSEAVEDPSKLHSVCLLCLFISPACIVIKCNGVALGSFSPEYLHPVLLNYTLGPPLFFILIRFSGRNAASRHVSLSIVSLAPHWSAASCLGTASFLGLGRLQCNCLDFGLLVALCGRCAGTSCSIQISYW